MRNARREAAAAAAAEAEAEDSDCWSRARFGAGEATNITKKWSTLQEIHEVVRKSLFLYHLNENMTEKFSFLLLTHFDCLPANFNTKNQLQNR